jgi:hypothetical protein
MVILIFVVESLIHLLVMQFFKISRFCFWGADKHLDLKHVAFLSVGTVYRV